MHYTWKPMLIVLVASTALAADGAEQCKAECKRPDVKTKHFVVINATTGQRIDGGLRFPQADDVAVTFKKNPFKYSYKIGVLATPLETAIVSGFLGLIPGFSQIIDGAMGQPAPAVKREGAGAPPPACKGVDTEIVDSSAVRALTAEGAQIKAELKKLADANSKYDEFVRLTDVDVLDDPCVACNNASELNAVIGTLTDVSKLAAGIDKFKKDVEPLKPKIDAIAKVPNCAKALGDPFMAIAALPSDADAYAEAIKKLQDNKASYTLMANILKTALASDQAFWEVRYPQTAGDATDVTINIAVKNLRVANAQAVQLDPIHLTIGESRIKLTAGIGFSTINDVKIIRQSSVGADNAVANRFGYENKAPFKPNGVVMLNAPLKNWKYVSFGLNTGLVVSSRESNAQVEYTAGGSCGFLKNTLFLNFGFHTAKVEHLGGGFHIGDLVPANLPDPLPTEKNWSYGAMISITYKIR